MAISAEHRSKFVALHWQWRRLHASEKFSSETKNPKQTNKKINDLEFFFRKSYMYIEIFMRVLN